MKQQINLYQDGLVEKKAPLHAGAIAGILLGCGLLLLSVSIFLAWQQNQMETELEQLNQEQKIALAGLQELKMNNPPREKDPLLTESFKRRQAELAGRKPLLAYLENFEPEKGSGFSTVLKGFAQYPLKGVWLTNIRLNNTERKILLAGSAFKSDLIPAYVQHLGDKKVLSSQTFASLKVQQFKDSKRQVDFRLESDFGVSDE